jgi:hypothetical protein
MRRGRLGVQLQSQPETLFGLRGRTGLKLRFGKVVAGAELLRLLLRGVLEQRQSLGGILLAQQQDSRVQLGFIQAGLEFQGLAVFGDAFGILVQEAVRHGEVEMREIILGVGCDRLA